MKTYYFFLTSLLFIAFFTACSDSNDKAVVSEENLLSSYKAEGPVIVNITCSGACSDGSQCYFRIVATNQYGECNCEGCTLIVNIEGAIIDTPEQNVVFQDFLSRNLFLDRLDEFVLGKFGDDSYNIISIEYAVYKKDYYLHYEIITERGKTETVMYVSVADSDSKGQGGTFEIDCSGTCTDADETCRERYVFNPPSVECTCEGEGCTMKVTHH